MPYNHLEPRIKLMFLVNLISISSFSLEHIGLDNCCRIFRDRFSTNKINLLKIVELQMDIGLNFIHCLF